jgi:hypothetical protein
MYFRDILIPFATTDRTESPAQASTEQTVGLFLALMAVKGERAINRDILGPPWQNGVVHRNFGDGFEPNTSHTGSAWYSCLIKVDRRSKGADLDRRDHADADEINVARLPRGVGLQASRGVRKERAGSIERGTTRGDDGFGVRDLRHCRDEREGHREYKLQSSYFSSQAHSQSTPY